MFPNVNIITIRLVISNANIGESFKYLHSMFFYYISVYNITNHITTKHCFRHTFFVLFTDGICKTIHVPPSYRLKPWRAILSVWKQSFHMDSFCGGFLYHNGSGSSKIREQPIISYISKTEVLFEVMLTGVEGQLFKHNSWINWILKHSIKETELRKRTLNKSYWC